MDSDLKNCLGQIIDNQLSLMKKIDNLTVSINNLVNIFAKYDTDYQIEIAKENNGL